MKKIISIVISIVIIYALAVLVIENVVQPALGINDEKCDTMMTIVENVLEEETITETVLWENVKVESWD